MGARRLIVTALAALTLLAVSPAPPAEAGSPPATAQGGGKGGSDNGNAGGNGNGNGYGTSTTTSTTQPETTTTTQVVSTTTTQVVSTTTTQVVSTTTTVAFAGGGDDGTTTTTLATPITTGPLGSDPADGEPTTTTVAPPTSTTSSTSPQPVGGDGATGGQGGDQPVEIESRPAFLADFADRDHPPVVSSGAASPARLGALFDTWAWSDAGGGGLTGATFEMLAAVIRAVMTAGSGMAVPASLTATLLVLALVARHRETDGAIPSAP
jgi:hypothetical protein